MEMELLTVFHIILLWVNSRKGTKHNLISLHLLAPRVPFGDFLFCCGQGSNCVYLVVLLYHRKNTVLIIVECYFDFSYCYDLLLLLFIDVGMLVLEVCSVT